MRLLSYFQPLCEHTVRSLHFLSNNSTLIFRENCRFFWVKNSRKSCGFGLFSCWQLWFHEKKCPKKFGWKSLENVGFLSKLNFWTNFDFSNSVWYYLKVKLYDLWLLKASKRKLDKNGQKYVKLMFLSSCQKLFILHSVKTVQDSWKRFMAKQSSSKMPACKKD